MGMTIYYRLHANVGSPDKARHLVEQLRRRVLDLPLKEVGQIVELADDACKRQQDNCEESKRWLAIQAAQYVIRDEVPYPILPNRVFAFHTWPGEGCETANFGLGMYPKGAQVEDQSKFGHQAAQPRQTPWHPRKCP